jgi:hypothetical protein
MKHMYFVVSVAILAQRAPLQQLAHSAVMAYNAPDGQPFSMSPLPPIPASWSETETEIETQPASLPRQLWNGHDETVLEVDDSIPLSQPRIYSPEGTATPVHDPYGSVSDTECIPLSQPRVYSPEVTEGTASPVHDPYGSEPEPEDNFDLMLAALQTVTIACTFFDLPQTDRISVFWNDSE